jgi:hypothetical protein
MAADFTPRESAEAFESFLPSHKAGLTLTHNDHLGYYMSVEDWESTTSSEWVSTEERERAHETGEMWTLRWYPDTPVGFHEVSASSLAALIAYVLQEETDGG